MKSVDIFQKIADTVVQQASTGVWYLEPLWFLDENVAEILDDAIEYNRVKEMLELLVQKKNADADLIHPVVDWLYKLMTEEGQYMLNDTEMRFMEDVMEYAKASPSDLKRKPALEGWSFEKKD